MPDLSFIIINRNTKQLLLDCITSIRNTVRVSSYEIFVVDNGSTDGSTEAVRKQHPDVKLIANSGNLGFAKANNIAIRSMSGKYAVLLNSDTLLKEGAIDAMLSFMEANPDAGMCGPQLLYRDGSKQTSTGHFPDFFTEFTSTAVRALFQPRKRPVSAPSSNGASRVDFIIGACMFVRKTAIEQAGMLDEDYFFFYEEIDWCYRLNKAGWYVYHVPDIEIFHFGGQSTVNLNLRARVESWRSRYLFFKKNVKLSPVPWFGLLLLGFFQNAYQFFLYTLLNTLSLFLFKRLRRRWGLFAYLLVWHLRGRPVSMGIPR